MRPYTCFSTGRERWTRSLPVLLRARKRVSSRCRFRTDPPLSPEPCKSGGSIESQQQHVVAEAITLDNLTVSREQSPRVCISRAATYLDDDSWHS
jgi:hypothetical protein